MPARAFDLPFVENFLLSRTSGVPGPTNIAHCERAESREASRRLANLHLGPARACDLVVYELSAYNRVWSVP
jgi:hypothetical protein